MYDVDTIFVVSASRGPYPTEDITRAIKWSCNSSSYHIVVVNTGSKTPYPPSTDKSVTLVDSPLPQEAPIGFHRAAALQQILTTGITYRQVIMLDDTCLLLTQDIGTFFKPQIAKEQIGVIGVQARDPYIDQWRITQNMMFRWQLPLDGWERPPISLVDDILILAPRMVAPFIQRDLLVPPSCERWPGTYGSYLSWACHMMGFYVVSWGYEDKPLPPLYVNHCHGSHLPPPQMLSQGFLLFSPANGVMGYSESDLRELYKKQRGERARELPRFGPVATGLEQRDAMQPTTPEVPTSETT